MVSCDKIPLQSYRMSGADNSRYSYTFTLSNLCTHQQDVIINKCTKSAPKNENILFTQGKAQLKVVVCSFVFVACRPCFPLLAIVCLNRKKNVGRCPGLEPPPSSSVSFRSGQQSIRPSRKLIQRAGVSGSGRQRVEH